MPLEQLVRSEPYTARRDASDETIAEGGRDLGQPCPRGPERERRGMVTKPCPAPA